MKEVIVPVTKETILGDEVTSDKKRRGNVLDHFFTECKNIY